PVLRGIFGRAGGDGAPPSAGGDQDREQGQSPRRGGSETHGPSDTTRPRAIHTVLGAPPVPFADPMWYARDRGAAAEEHGAVRHPGHRQPGGARARRGASGPGDVGRGGELAAAAGQGALRAEDPGVARGSGPSGEGGGRAAV